jgi:hypothetical protein
MSNFVIVGFAQKYDTGKPVDYVTLAPGGEAFERTQTPIRVKELMPPENPPMSVQESDSYKAQKARWDVIGPAYDAWKNGAELPERGTPLAIWPGVTADQAALIRKMGLLSVEDVAATQPEVLAKLPWPNSRDLPKLAASFLAGKDKSDLAAKLAAAEERMAAMEQMLAEVAAEKAAKKKAEAA